MYTRTFSPKELARVIGVSESSVKRWADAGLIEISRTAGGHRRIRFHDALRFIREQGMDVLRPDLLGLSDLGDLPLEIRTGEPTEEMLFALLRSEEAERTPGLLTAAYLGGADPAALFDGPVAGALYRLGALWEDDEQGIYLEHVATSLFIEAINQMRGLIPPPPDGAPVALGGAPEGDPYLLPSLMVAAVLADAGYTVVNLGPNTPISAFRHAVADQQPAMVWLSATSELTPETRHTLVQELLIPLQEQSIEVVVGGRDTELHAAAWPSSVRVLTSMEGLATLVNGRRSGVRGE